MERRSGSTKLAPAGFVVEHAEIDTDCVFLDVRATAVSATCPCCGTSSRRTQSRYLRQAADLPIAGRRVFLRVTVRRFWCDAVLCRRRIFAERFGPDILAPLSRRTGRLETIVHHLGLALGGRPAAAFADRLMMPVSNDTLLRVVRRRTEQPRDELAIIGIDDFAFRRGQRYGTIVCDLERRRPVTLLPDREQATSQAWLMGHPSITTVARDRGGGYGEAIAKALPHADQVADRWHLMENASRAFLDAVSKSMRQIRKAVGSTIIDPKLLTYAERLQYEGYQRRQEANEAILELSKQGIPIKQIVKRTGHSRKLVRSVLRGQRSDVFRVRQSSLEECSPGWTAVGGKARTMHRRSGAKCARRASAARSASSLNGRGADGWPKGRSKRACPHALGANYRQAHDAGARRPVQIRRPAGRGNREQCA